MVCRLAREAALSWLFFVALSVVVSSAGARSASRPVPAHTAAACADYPDQTAAQRAA
jgi:hypothetical protein